MSLATSLCTRHTTRQSPDSGLQYDLSPFCSRCLSDATLELELAKLIFDVWQAERIVHLLQTASYEKALKRVIVARIRVANLVLERERVVESQRADREGLDAAAVVFEREPVVSFAEDVIVFHCGREEA